MIPILSKKSVDRACSSCRMCCEGWLTGEAYGHEFYPGKPCHYLNQSGCGIYMIRPETPCQTFKCHWKINTRVPEWMRPDQSGVILVNRSIENYRYVLLVLSNRPVKDQVFEWCQEHSETGIHLVARLSSSVRVFSKDPEFTKLFTDANT
jgi:hypothetical protein